MSPPQFLVVGHVVQDIPSDERADATAWTLGGTASYAALLASRLGLRSAVLTSATPDLALGGILPGIDVARTPSDHCTRIRNVYTETGRVQYVPSRAALLTPQALPDDWRRSDIVLLGPVAGEVSEAFAECFPESMVGLSAQGWLREIGPDGRVRPVAPQGWRSERLFSAARVLFVSDEDLPKDAAPDVLRDWSGRVTMLAYTSSDRGAEVCSAGVWRHIAAFPAKAVDPTGAGDVFATAFLVRLSETDDPWESARFAACAASFVVEGPGVSAIPGRSQIEERLRTHPEIVCAGPL